MTHPYFVEQARARMHRAGGDPGHSAALAEWAEAAHAENDSRRGVVVAEDGELIAETIRVVDERTGASATYVVTEDAERWQLRPTEVGLALGALRRATGKRLIHVRMSEVCTGSAAFIPVA